MVIHACNPSPKENGKFEFSLWYIVRPCLKYKNEKGWEGVKYQCLHSDVDSSAEQCFRILTT
jgi:hypothetical protein